MKPQMDPLFAPSDQLMTQCMSRHTKPAEQMDLLLASPLLPLMSEERHIQYLLRNPAFNVAVAWK